MSSIQANSSIHSQAILSNWSEQESDTPAQNRSKRGRPQENTATLFAFTDLIMETWPMHKNESAWEHEAFKKTVCSLRITVQGRNPVKRNIKHLITCAYVPPEVREKAIAFHAYLFGNNESKMQPNDNCEFCKGKPRLDVILEEQAILSLANIPSVEDAAAIPALEESVSDEPVSVETLLPQFPNVFKLGNFEKMNPNYLQLRGISTVGKTPFNRLFLNEGSPALSNPTRIHVTLDRSLLEEVIADLGQFTLLLCVENTILAKTAVDITKKSFTTSPWPDFPKLGKLFTDYLFFDSSQPKSGHDKESSLITDDIIHTQFNWPFRSKKDLCKWQGEIQAEVGQEKMADIKKITKVGLTVWLTSADEKTYYAPWFIPFSKTQLFKNLDLENL